MHVSRGCGGPLERRPLVLRHLAGCALSRQTGQILEMERCSPVTQSQRVRSGSQEVLPILVD